MQALEEEAKKEFTGLKLEVKCVTSFSPEKYNLFGILRQHKLGDKNFVGQERLADNHEIQIAFSQFRWNLQDTEIREYFHSPTGLAKDLKDKTIVVYVDSYSPPTNAERKKPDSVYESVPKIEGTYNGRFVRCINI
ncbi:Oidioi.mRNA.OKI2018_I69.PAR.g12701.t1.cds [Oikopleura dioica]|uniref:Oidioi.mRNA.OKI2018_I69.PAR.g12701.t1.cds n=1 Tax=Oikopleura dioica TaxID=34765 RepID=A0ABN7S168_OIKDI|nr:Oidioi.mRNA.OKI2018_I69.PAR.g12701.t1.cds [Oikopleura dioica]